MLFCAAMLSRFSCRLSCASLYLALNAFQPTARAELDPELARGKPDTESAANAGTVGVDAGLGASGAPESAPSGAWSQRRVRYDAHATLSWDGDIGAGGRADISIFDRHRLYDSHDELSVSIGGDVTFLTFGGSNRVTVLPTATIQWSLGAGEKLALYPELGLVGQITRSGWGGIYPNIGFGGRFYLYKHVSIFARVGWPVAFSAGATF